MGNCVFRPAEVEAMVKVVTSNGGIMELYAPITAQAITNQFPGHAVFRSSELLSHNHQLLPGHLYHLLPINSQETLSSDATDNTNRLDDDDDDNNTTTTPYRKSFGKQRMSEVVPKYNNRGMWKVKLIISPEELSQILAQDTRTVELIESVRTVAKCSNGTPLSSTATSDQLSVNSSRKAPSGKYDCNYK